MTDQAVMQVFFFRKRLETLIGTKQITEYQEDLKNQQVLLTIEGVKSLKAGIQRKICRLFETEFVTLSTKGNSLKIVIGQVKFPLEN